MGPIRIYIFALLPVTVAGLLKFFQEEKNINIEGYSDCYTKFELYLENNSDDILFVDDSCLTKDEIENFINMVVKHPVAAKIIWYTSSNEPSYLKYLVNRGIRGIVHKTSSKDKILEAVQLINLEGVYLDNRINFAVFSHNLALNRITNAPYWEALSKREKEIVELISQKFKNKEIALKLSISTKTVENHKERIKDKLGLKKIEDLYELIKFT